MNKSVQKGFTLFELLISMSIILIISSVIYLNIRPEEKRQLSRDTKRLSDLSMIDNAINGYRLDYGSYPDETDVLRQSNILPDENTSLTKATSGWINQDLSKYISHMPIDPINDDTYYYSYMHNTNGYELNCIFENKTDLHVKDGGNNDDVYEIGNNLTIIN